MQILHYRPSLFFHCCRQQHGREPGKACTKLSTNCHCRERLFRELFVLRYLQISLSLFITMCHSFRAGLESGKFSFDFRFPFIKGRGKISFFFLVLFYKIKIVPPSFSYPPQIHQSTGKPTKIKKALSLIIFEQGEDSRTVLWTAVAKGCNPATSHH